MLNYRAAMIFFWFTYALTFGCASSAQINGVEVVEENKEKKYTQIKTTAFKGDATILKDTTNQFNKYPSTNAVKQYTPSLTDIQVYEDVLKNSFVSNEQVAEANTGETFVKHYKMFNRQYSGYIDKAGDTILVVSFLDFNNKKAKKFFYDWKYQNAFFGTVLYLHKKSPGIYCYRFNLRTKELSSYKV